MKSNKSPQLETTPVALKAEREVALQVQRCLADVFVRLKEVLPHAEVEHVGATAVPGAVTKGDVDVVVRVPRQSFRSTVEVLTVHFSVKQRENWTKSFASFGDDTGYDLPLGIQLVVRSSKADFLTFIRDHLIAQPKALAEYNRLKVRHAQEGPEGYWKAKNAFFDRILASAGGVKKRKSAP